MILICVAVSFPFSILVSPPPNFPKRTPSFLIFSPILCLFFLDFPTERIVLLFSFLFFCFSSFIRAFLFFEQLFFSLILLFFSQCLRVKEMHFIDQNKNTTPKTKTAERKYKKTNTNREPRKGDRERKQRQTAYQSRHGA